MRRGNGDGGIFKLSGKRRRPYAVRVTVGWTTDGKQKFRYIGYYENKSDAKKALAEYLLSPQVALMERKTLKAVFDDMLEKSKYTEGTQKQYISGMNKIPSLWKREIATITLQEIENLLKPETPATQARIKKTLSNTYRHALKYDYVEKNIIDLLDVAPITPVKEKRPFTLEEIQWQWDNYRTVRHGDIPLILLYSGLRISELLDMETADVDLENKVWFVKASKTAAGIRTIPIHDAILPLLKKRYKAENKYLFMNGDRRLPYSTYMREFWKVEGHTPHECRHTFVTHLTKLCNDQVAVKRLIGHATTDITDHYTHRTVDELRKELLKLEYK